MFKTPFNFYKVFNIILAEFSTRFSPLLMLKYKGHREYISNELIFYCYNSLKKINSIEYKY